MVRDFNHDGQEKKLLDLPLEQQNIGQNRDDPELSELIVGVKWQKKFSREDAIWPAEFVSHHAFK
jgi:hypothetical protein